MAITPSSFIRSPILLFVLTAALLVGSGFASYCVFTCDREQVRVESTNEAINQVKIEANRAQQVATVHQAKTATKEAKKGWLGVKIQSLTPQRAARVDAPRNLRGALVLHLQDGMPAKKAGINQGDVITHFDGKRIKSACQLTKHVAATAPGKTVQVRVVRDGVPMILLPKLGIRPAGCGCKKK